jgi:hypothetical protein
MSEIKKQIGRHKFRAKLTSLGIEIYCPSMPDLATKHNGKGDALEAIEEFETRAQVREAEPPKQEEPPSLLDYLEEREAQTANLSRVRSRIGLTVLAFLRERLATPGRAEFTAADLKAYVSEVCGTAPGSPDRILRALRQDGECCYEVVSRRQSRYRVASVCAAAGGTTEAA